MGEEHRYRLGGEDRKDPCGACMLLLPVCAGAPPTE